MCNTCDIERSIANVYSVSWQPILLLVLHSLCPANPSFSMTLTVPSILLVVSVILREGLEMGSRCRTETVIDISQKNTCKLMDMYFTILLSWFLEFIVKLEADLPTVTTSMKCKAAQL